MMAVYAYDCVNAAPALPAGATRLRNRRYIRQLREKLRMPTPAKPTKPAQAPGEAESPPSTERDRDTERAVQQTDPTEPVQTEGEPPEQKPG